MKVWILGGEGLLGRTLEKLLRFHKMDVIADGRSRADVTNLKMLEKRGQELSPTHIVNCAAYTNVDQAETEREVVFAVNAGGAEHAAMIAKSVGAFLVHVSTDYVFGGEAKEGTFCEEDRSSPINLYGESKREGEQRIQNILPEACIIRTSWLFGSEGNQLLSRLRTLLEEREELSLVMDQRGTPTFYLDLANALFCALQKPKPGIFHYAGNEAISRYELGVWLWQEMQKKSHPIRCKKITPIPSTHFMTPAKRPSNSALNVQKWAHTFNCPPSFWKSRNQELLCES